MLLGPPDAGGASASGHVCTHRDHRAGCVERVWARGEPVVDHVVCRTVRPAGPPGPSGPNQPRAWGSVVLDAPRRRRRGQGVRLPSRAAQHQQDIAARLARRVRRRSPADLGVVQPRPGGSPGREASQAGGEEAARRHGVGPGLGVGAGRLVATRTLAPARAARSVSGGARRRLGGDLRAVTLGRALRRLITRRRWGRLGPGR